MSWLVLLSYENQTELLTVSIRGKSYQYRCHPIAYAKIRTLYGHGSLKKIVDLLKTKCQLLTKGNVPMERISEMKWNRTQVSPNDPFYEYLQDVLGPIGNVRVLANASQDTEKVLAKNSIRTQKPKPGEEWSVYFLSGNVPVVVYSAKYPQGIDIYITTEAIGFVDGLIGPGRRYPDHAPIPGKRWEETDLVKAVMDGKSPVEVLDGVLGESLDDLSDSDRGSFRAGSR